jgi:hypothetical protein
MRFLQDNPNYKDLIKIDEAEIHWRDSILGALVTGAWNLGGWLTGKVEKGYKTVLLKGKATEYAGVYMKAVVDAHKQLHGDEVKAEEPEDEDEDDTDYGLSDLEERVKHMQETIDMLGMLKKILPSLQAIAHGKKVRAPRKPKAVAASNPAPAASNSNPTPAPAASNSNSTSASSPAPAASNSSPAPAASNSNSSPAPAAKPAATPSNQASTSNTHNNVWTAHEEAEKKKEAEAKKLKEEEEDKQKAEKEKRKQQHLKNLQNKQNRKGSKKTRSHHRPVVEGSDFDLELYLEFLSEELDTLNEMEFELSEGFVNIFEQDDAAKVNTSDVDKTYVKVLDILDNISELPERLLSYEDIKDKKAIIDLAKLVSKIIGSDDLKQSVIDSGDDKFLKALKEYSNAAITLIQESIEKVEEVIEQIKQQLESEGVSTEEKVTIKQKIKNFINNGIFGDTEDTWHEVANLALIEGDYITEAFGVSNALNSFTKKGYPKSEEMKKLATSLVNVKKLKVIEYDSKNIARVNTKKRNDAGFDVTSGKIEMDPKLEVIWQRAILQVEDHFQDYIDLDAVNAKKDSTKMSKDEEKKSTETVGAYTNTEVTGVKEFVRKLTGYDKSVVFCLPMQKGGNTSYMLMRRIVDKRYAGSSLTSQNLLIHWFQVFGTFTPSNGKMAPSDMLGKGIQKIMEDGYMIAGLTTTSTTSPRTVYLYDKNGKLLLSNGKRSNFDDVEKEFKGLASNAVGIDEFKTMVDSKFGSGPWVDATILSRGIVDTPKIAENYNLDLTQPKYRLVNDGFERAHKNQKKLMQVFADIKT